MARDTLKNLAYVTLPTIVLCLIGAEVFFRTVIPSKEYPYTYYDRADGVMRYDPLPQSDGLYTLGRFAQVRSRWHINNYGWNSDVDYVPYGERTGPLIAIIGDSFVEALMTPVGDNIAAVLRRKLAGRCNAYAFGMSGAPLSQYLQMSRYVRRHFRPEVLVIVLVHNDFDESLRIFNDQYYFARLDTVDGTFVVVPPTPYEPKLVRRILRRSAIVRYMASNLSLSWPFGWWKDSIDVQKFNANVDVEAVRAREKLTRRATTYLMHEIVTVNEGTTVVFMVDAPRRDIYEGKMATSTVVWMNHLIADTCAQHGYRWIDLTGPFLERFTRDSVQFNSQVDSHWDAVGHRAAAETLLDSLGAWGTLGVNWRRSP